MFRFALLTDRTMKWTGPVEKGWLMNRRILTSWERIFFFVIEMFYVWHSFVLVAVLGVGPPQKEEGDEREEKMGQSFVGVVVAK